MLSAKWNTYNGNAEQNTKEKMGKGNPEAPKY